MHILIADNKEESRVLHSQTLARYGSVDVVQDGRDAVIAYVNTGSRGAFYELIIMDQQLTMLDGNTTVEMIRFFESEHRKSGKRTKVCIIFDDDNFQQQYEYRFGSDARTTFQRKPIDLVALESIASSIAAELEMKNFNNFARMGRPLSVKA